jgi:hypothetical protein
MVAPTCSASSGGVPSAFWEMLNWEVDRILWMGVLCLVTCCVAISDRSTLLLISALDGSGWTTSRLGRFTPRKDPVPILTRLGGSQGHSGRVHKISSHNGIQFPDRPASSETLYKLNYPGIYVCCNSIILNFSITMQKSTWPINYKFNPQTQ